MPVETTATARDLALARRLLSGSEAKTRVEYDLAHPGSE